MPRCSRGRMQPPLRARSFQSDRRCRSLSASAIRLVRHSAPLRFSMIARPHEVGLVNSWRADSQQQNGPGFGAISVLPCRLIATALLARDCAAVVPLDRSGHRAAVLPWANGDAAWADADGDI